jgi:hypothetical protein
MTDMCAEGNKMDCNNCESKQACVPFFVHENTMMHYNHANKRMLISLIAVCITFIVTIVIFVFGYTVREKNWLDTLTRVTAPEVADGIQQNADH